MMGGMVMLDEKLRCRDCRWHFPLLPAHDPTEWRNCLALPYPDCTINVFHVDAKCVVPHLFQPKEKETA